MRSSHDLRGDDRPIGTIVHFARVTWEWENERESRQTQWIQGQTRFSASSRSAMDDIDRRILLELQEEARLTRSELGKRVGLSPSAVADRLRRLEESGAILAYRAELNPRALGYEMAAILRVRPDIGQLKKIAEVASTTREVVECYRVTGEDCYVMQIVLHPSTNSKG